MVQARDYQLFKDQKSGGEEVMTTPLHLACRLSNDEGIRILIEKQSYDPNILLKGKSALYELLCDAARVDFNVLAFLMRTC